MLFTEYDYDTDIAVQREEEHRIAFADGELKGKLDDARNFKALGISPEIIVKCTGLTLEQVNGLK